MISICIPIYNFTVLELIEKLDQQGKLLNVNYEIICVDDASNQHYLKTNESISKYDLLQYYKLDNNIGRSKIRNFLAEKAQYENLLFIDCDSAITSSSFLNNYKDAIDLAKVIYGGRTHSKNPPLDKNLYLRWLYGTKREDIFYKNRILNPYLSFKSNNFLIEKELFQKIKFDESLNGYGHEDTLFSLELKKNSIDILHIENPITHIGLEKTEEFLLKTKEGIKNLSLLMKKNNSLIHEIKLLKTYNKLKKLKITSLFRITHPILANRFLKNLLSSKPKLFYLDLYKLTFLIHYSK